MAADPLLSLRQVCRYYDAGDTQVRALHNVSLDIHSGEFVAIMGQSGSGKSTLMNILGCLDKPTAGEYRVSGHSVGQLDADELSALRLKTFGFVFQRYQLLSSYTAQENVALPAIYSGQNREQRLAKANALLQQLGLEERTEHRPGELSGGQQQRVSIARALVNGAEVILADEPTGALDSKSGQQVLALLKELNQQGVTVILITHEAEVAEHARRIIHIKDGEILSDDGEQAAAQTPLPQRPVTVFPNISIIESVRIAMTALHANLFRTLLTLLGIIIGVSSVVVMLAIGEGSKQEVLKGIEAMGTNMLLIRPGGAGIRSSGDNASLSVEDAEALRQIPHVLGVAPERNSRVTLRTGNQDYDGRIRGTSPDYPVVKDWSMAQGVFFTEEDMDSYAPVMVIGQTVAEQLFPDNQDPIGAYVFLSNSLYQVIGVLEAKGATAGGADMDEEVIIPLTTGMARIFGRNYLHMITVKVDDPDRVDEVQDAVTALLAQRHGSEDFMVRNTASLLEAIGKTADTMTWLLASVAAISLLVGGIGVMNIMLVSVSERRREIGLRIATGAKPGDILRQFSIEALVVCSLGGIIGVALGIAAGLTIQYSGTAVHITPPPALLAFSSALLVGLIFGHAPARKAAALDPIQALSDE